MTLPLSFKPKKQFDLIRLGRNNDGGYLLGNKTIKITKTLVSFGIYDDWSFEENFLKINNKCQLICYDSIVNKKFLFKFFLKKVFKNLFDIKTIYCLIIKYISFIIFFKKNKLINKTITYTDILKISKNHQDKLFFKIDIEGSEYRVLNDLIKIKKKIYGIIIEFHDVDLHRTKIINFIKKIEIPVTHIHPNNFGGRDLKGDPKVIEMTFERYSKKVSNKVKLPNFFDQKNDRRNADIFLKFS